MAHLGYLLLGLGTGSAIAALALGVVLTHRASGVVNFAHAATGVYIAFAFYTLRNTGDLVLPIVGLPAEIHVVDRPTVFTALVVCLALAAAVGALQYLLIFRLLRRRPALARVVATLGLFLYFISLIRLRFGATGATGLEIRSILPSGVVRIGSTVVFRDRFILAGILLAVTALLWLLYRFTRFGLATRAAAEEEAGAVRLGISPDLLGVANWALAAMLAGGAVILVAPIVRLDPAGTSLLIVPAVAAALVASFSSFPAAVASGLAIGMVQSELLNLQADVEWLPDIGLQQGVPFIVILVVLGFRGERLAGRSLVLAQDLPPAPDPVKLVPVTLAIAAAGTVGLLTLDSGWRQGIIISAIVAIIALSVVVVTGYIGQISLAPFAFAGVAAFALVRLSEDFGVPFPIAPIIAALVATVVGVIAALPAIGVRGMNLAIATLAAAVAVEELVFKWTWFTGGSRGARPPQPELFGVDLGISGVGTDFPKPAFGILVLVVLVLCTLGVIGLRRGRTGLGWLAVRANERAAAAAGVKVAQAKITAFGVSGFLAGIGGSLLAYQRQQISSASFGVMNSLSLLAITYLAGISSPAGAMVAGLLATGGLLTVYLEQSNPDASQYQEITNAVMLIVAAIAFSGGLTGSVRSGSERLMAKLRPQTGDDIDRPGSGFAMDTVVDATEGSRASRRPTTGTAPATSATPETSPVAGSLSPSAETKR